MHCIGSLGSRRRLAAGNCNRMFCSPATRVPSVAH